MKQLRSRLWKTVKKAELARVAGIAFDIDDTLSTHGKLTETAFTALWALKKNGFVLVPITGRPAGWCDHIARFWPVDAVIGENGAFAFFMKEGRLRRIETPKDIETVTARTRLTALRSEIEKRFPNVRFASDQPYREYDLAIDYCEDVVRWPKKEVQALVELCQSRGARAKVSSIHVNTWYGSFDKQKGFQNWLDQGLPGVETKKTKKLSKAANWIFIGDSPNDEPSFRYFTLSVAVANIKNFLSDLEAFPTFVTSKESGQGFTEFASRLLRKS